MSNSKLQIELWIFTLNPDPKCGERIGRDELCLHQNMCYSQLVQSGFRKKWLLSPFLLLFIAKDGENLGIENRQRDGFYGSLGSISTNLAKYFVRIRVEIHIMAETKLISLQNLFTKYFRLIWINKFAFFDKNNFFQYFLRNKIDCLWK